MAAGQAIEHAPQQNKHIILFADANDAEEPGQYEALLADFEKANITVSVIGLGTEQDKDAEFLKDIAKRGKGEIYFADNPHDLPRVFAQDTLTMARSTFVDVPTAAAVLPDLYALGDVPRRVPRARRLQPHLSAPGCHRGVVAADEYRAPIVAFHYKGLGRAAAFHGADRRKVWNCRPSRGTASAPSS